MAFFLIGCNEVLAPGVNTFIKYYSCPHRPKNGAGRRFFGSESIISCEYHIHMLPVFGSLLSIASMVLLDGDTSRLNMSMYSASDNFPLGMASGSSYFLNCCSHSGITVQVSQVTNRKPWCLTGFGSDN